MIAHIPRTVEISYFYPNGRLCSTRTSKTFQKTLTGIEKEIKKRQEMLRLPGLEKGTGARYTILIQVMAQPRDQACLIQPLKPHLSNPTKKELSNDA